MSTNQAKEGAPRADKTLGYGKLPSVAPSRPRDSPEPNGEEQAVQQAVGAAPAGPQPGSVLLARYIVLGPCRDEPAEESLLVFDTVARRRCVVEILRNEHGVFDVLAESAEGRGAISSAGVSVAAAAKRLATEFNWKSRLLRLLTLTASAVVSVGKGLSVALATTIRWISRQIRAAAARRRGEDSMAFEMDDDSCELETVAASEEVPASEQPSAPGGSRKAPGNTSLLLKLIDDGDPTHADPVAQRSEADSRADHSQTESDPPTVS